MLVYSKEIFSDFRSLVLLFKLQVLEIEDIENEQDLLAVAGQLLFYLEHAVPLGYAPLVLDRWWRQQRGHEVPAIFWENRKEIFEISNSGELAGLFIANF